MTPANCVIVSGSAVVSTIFAVLLTVGSSCAPGHRSVSKTDSLTIKSQIEGFYAWYTEQCHRGTINKNFNPQFARQADGKTSLDFTNYRDILRRHGFSDKVIDKKVSGYRACVDNLGKIPYDTFLTFKDLDDFENIECAFSNTYEWTGGMEPSDGAELMRLVVVDKSTVKALIRIFYNGNDERHYHRPETMLMRQTKVGWQVDDHY